MTQLTDQMEVNRLFLEVAGRIMEAEREGATELIIPLPLENTPVAIKVAALFNQTEVHARVRGEALLIIEWANLTRN